MIRDYINSSEQEDFLQIPFMNIVAKKILKEWTEKDNLTKEESKLLKYFITYSDKFYKTVWDRLGKPQQEQYTKRLGKFNFMYVDDYQTQRIMRDRNDKMNYAVMKRDDFEYWCEEVMNHKCNGCTKDWKECDFHRVLEDNMAPEPTGYNLSNCRYAYENVKFNIKKGGNKNDK